MNICFAGEDFGLGGIQRITHVLGERLERDYNVFYFSLYNQKSYYGQKITISKPNGFYSKYERAFKRRAMNLIKNSYNPNMVFKKNVQDLTMYLKNNEIDTLILNAGLMTSFAPKIKEKNPELKIISWQHNEAKTYFENYYKYIIKEYKEGLKFSDAVVCLTTNDKKEFGKYNDKTYQINNMVYIKDKMLLNKKFDLKSVKIGFCSRYSLEPKGIDYLIDICKLLPNNYELYFAGTGSKDEKKKLKKMIDKNDLNKRVHLLGALQDNTLDKFYSEIDLFLSTSRWEGFGLVIVEAMSYGVPVVSFNTSGPTMILKDGEYGKLINKYNVKDFAQEIINLCSNPIELQKYSLLSRERSIDFSIENVYARWKELIENV